MMRKRKLINTWLCAGLMTICMAGCGAAGGDSGSGNDIGMDENIAANDGNVAESENVAEDETNSREIDSAELLAVEAAEEEVMFEGLSLSILGDSISTFDEWVPWGFNVFYPLDGEVTDVSQTWWMRLLDDTGMELCSNNSSSGSTCVGDSLSEDAIQYGCNSYRISFLTGKQGKMPDIIIIYMGTNDLLEGVPIGDNDGTKLVEEGEVENFSDAYCLMLDKLASEYPMAQVYCCTLLPVGEWGITQPYETRTNGIGLSSEDYSECIQIVAKNKGIPVIDLYHCGIEIDNLQDMTSDGVHLTPDGMECVERAVLSGIGGVVNK